ncbi:MAG TPA: response regulator [Thermoanaerobaculia bacterium]|nr:response regulator [Thermoanaerobaculia bacterium]
MEKPVVLLADDNEATCTLVTALLRSDFTVEVAFDGAHAIEKLKSRTYAAVLLDLRMPVTDGYGVLDYLQEERPEILSRVLIVTASLSAGEMERVRQYPVCGVVAKPFEVDALFGAVRQCVGDEGPQFIRGPLLASGVILFLAEMLRRV